MFFELEPLKRDGNGKDIFAGFPPYKTGDFYAQIGKALMIAHESACWLDFLADRNADTDRLKDEAQDEILELIGLMTAVATRIKFLADEFGYERNDLLKLQHRVIEINRRIGRIPKD